MKIISAGVTDPGKRRVNNEDAYLTHDELGLYAVADGVGGHEGGEVASRIAVETLSEVLPDLLRDGTPTTGLSSDLAPEIAALAPRRCVAISLRGRGESDAPETGYSLAEQASDITAVGAAAGSAHRWSACNIGYDHTGCTGGYGRR